MQKADSEAKEVVRQKVLEDQLKVVSTHQLRDSVELYEGGGRGNATVYVSAYIMIHLIYLVFSFHPSHIN